MGGVGRRRAFFFGSSVLDSLQGRQGAGKKMGEKKSCCIAQHQSHALCDAARGGAQAAEHASDFGPLAALTSLPQFALRSR